jgi:very-short-patch-repair endonuclease
MNPQEVKLWIQLRYLKQDGYHFRRQAPIGPYIVHFAEKRRKLIIEVDSSQHGEESGLSRDRVRDRFLAERGYRVLRFWNTNVATNMDGVMDTILAELAMRSNLPRSISAHSGDPEIERWLREDVVPTYDAMVANTQSAIPAKQVFDATRNRHAQTLKNSDV